MQLQERKGTRIGLATAVALAVLFPACQGSNSVTAPSAAQPAAAVSIAGTWTGNFQSFSTTGGASAASATFQQTGSDVTGMMAADSCGIRGAFRGTVSGNQLTGHLAMHGCLGGAVSGTVDGSDLSLTIGDFTKPVLKGDTILMSGGAASLRR